MPVKIYCEINCIIGTKPLRGSIVTYYIHTYMNHYDMCLFSYLSQLRQKFQFFFISLALSNNKGQKKA